MPVRMQISKLEDLEKVIDAMRSRGSLGWAKVKLEITANPDLNFYEVVIESVVEAMPTGMATMTWDGTMHDVDVQKIICDV